MWLGSGLYRTLLERRGSRCGACRLSGLYLLGRWRRSDPLPDHGPVRFPEVAVLGLGLHHRLSVRDLDLLLVDVALRVDEITGLVMGPRPFLRRRPHRYYYVATLLKASACVCKNAANCRMLVTPWPCPCSSCG